VYLCGRASLVRLAKIDTFQIVQYFDLYGRKSQSHYAVFESREKLRLQFPASEPKLPQCLNTAYCIFRVSGYNEIDIACIPDVTVDHHRVTADEEVLNFVVV